MNIFRVLVAHIDKFEMESSFVTWHIPHKYSCQMEKKSTIVNFI